MPKPQTISEVIDRIERLRDELLDVQTSLEKLESTESLAKHDLQQRTKDKTTDRPSHS
jgi:predicted  nucleic acid-binding Zn-ribbon protein